MKDNLHLLYRDALNRLHLEVLSLRRSNYVQRYYMCKIFGELVYRIADTNELRSKLFAWFEIDLSAFFGVDTLKGYGVEDFTDERRQSDWWYPPKAYALRLKFINWAIANIEAKLENDK